MTKYRKLAKPVVAVKLDLETDGFTYVKWGGDQRCKRGDWLVLNGGETYTVDNDSFMRTYKATGILGHFVKVTPVWAEVASVTGEMLTKEGTTKYGAGDYLVFNNEDRTDGYAMSKEKFESMYEPFGAG